MTGEEARWWAENNRGLIFKWSDDRVMTSLKTGRVFSSRLGYDISWIDVTIFVDFINRWDAGEKPTWPTHLFSGYNLYKGTPKSQQEALLVTEYMRCIVEGRRGQKEPPQDT